MKKSEDIITGFIIGAVSPIFLFLAFWWGSIPLLPEGLIGLCALLGLSIGFIIDMFYLKKWIVLARGFSLKIWMGIYLFYSFCILGFFMGVPLFNLILALPAGFLIGRRLARIQTDAKKYNRLQGRTCLFTTSVMAMVCLISAAIAINDPSTGANLKGMLHLGFEVTPAMIGWIIVLGGLTLLVLQWWLTSKTIRLFYRWNHR